jgi:uncharacterized protein YbaP (TraB family)
MGRIKVILSMSSVSRVLALSGGSRRTPASSWRAPLCLLALICSPPATADGLLYEVSGEKGRAWLLGSLHFGVADMYPLPQSVERAFASADRLMVEVNIRELDKNDVAATLETLGLFKGEERLQNHVPGALWQRLSSASEQVEVSLSSLEMQRPWLAAITLTAALVQRQRLFAREGVDLHFLDRANRWQIPIVELEGFKQQTRLLGDVSAPDQLQMLESSIEAIEHKDNMAKELLAAWRAADGDQVQRLLQEAFGRNASTERLQARLLDQRNEPMAQRIGEQIELGGTVFVVLGAAHLFGREGVPEKLRQLGFSVLKF